MTRQCGLTIVPAEPASRVGLIRAFGRATENAMERLAEALIRAVQYIADRTDDCTTDDDVKQLEDTAYLVSQCTEEEKGLLIKVANEIGFPEWPQHIGIVQ